MKKLFPLLTLLVFAAVPAFAQHSKTIPSATAPTSQPHINWPGKAGVPAATNPFGVATPRPKAMAPLQPIQASGLSESAEISILRGENGMPIFFEGKTDASGNAAESKPMDVRALDYCASLQPQGIAQPATEFTVKTTETDEQGNAHVRLEQVFNGLPVWGGEVICHTKNGAFERMNGRYFPTPKLATLVPAISADAAISTVKTAIGVSKIKTEWLPEELKLIDGAPFSATLEVFHPKQSLSGERLVWHVAARPNLLSRSEWFVDAGTGEVLDQFEHTCNLTGHFHAALNNAMAIAPVEAAPETVNSTTMLDGPVNINGTDLLGVNRSFTNGGWQVVGQGVAMENASKSMFNPSASNMPGDPVGVIYTLDAGNTSPENQNYNANLVASATTTFNNTKAISAHYNSEKSFDYYKTKFNRNSINGVGGNVVSIVNVSESDGTSMENAFWNGESMFYGNGGSTFKPLARGLDVGGHEMTHGVIEKTANLIYQDESGALNESFADVFGQMIDGDVNDWKIGEDVMQSSPGLPASLRDLANPHNGASQGSPFWQPNHTNEQYTGNQDNGGVHINSGITNRAFYLFASNAAVGTAKAEAVYYKALKDYLVKSSKFIDCRIAVIQAATDLYGATVANVAADAFTQVGIGSGTPGGNYLGQLSPNPGQDFIMCTSDDGVNLDLANGTGQLLLQLYNNGVKSRPSVTDNGDSFVFVDDAGYVYGGNLTYFSNPPTATVFQLTTNAGWRNAAISKDGRFLALIAENEEPRIYIVDLADVNQLTETYYLYNPTYSQGQITGDVKFADVLEFDYSGQFLMYDSYNELDGVGYWDIGFVQYWENGQFTDGGNAFITKLFSGLPEKVSINNPTFAKNSPYVIAFDLIDELSTPRNDILGANSETGDYDVIVSNNGVLGWPNYNRLDNKLLYEKASGTSYNLRLQGLNTNKIQPLGGSSQVVSSHYGGVWYANGTRSLQVGTNDVASQTFEVKISPNPTADFAQLSLQANAASAAIISVLNLLGETLMTRSVNLAEGENQLDLDLQHLPSGNYVVRIAAENGASAAVKLVKL